MHIERRNGKQFELSPKFLDQTGKKSIYQQNNRFLDGT